MNKEAHTSKELYYHRHLLYLNLCLKYKSYCYYTYNNFDDSNCSGLVVLNHPVIGQISYHMPVELMSYCVLANMNYRNKCNDFDGHNSIEVIKRLEELISYEIRNN